MRLASSASGSLPARLMHVASRKMCYYTQKQASPENISDHAGPFTQVFLHELRADHSNERGCGLVGDSLYTLASGAPPTAKPLARTSN
eukprot:3203052-Amphidinium_carterae.1